MQMIEIHNVNILRQMGKATKAGIRSPFRLRHVRCRWPSFSFSTPLSDEVPAP